MTSFKQNIGHCLGKCLRIDELSANDKRPAVPKHFPRKCPMFYLKDVIIGVFFLGNLRNSPFFVTGLVPLRSMIQSVSYYRPKEFSGVLSNFSCFRLHLTWEPQTWTGIVLFGSSKTFYTIARSGVCNVDMGDGDFQ